MFENVDGRTDGRRTDGGVTGILIAHLRAFGSDELIIIQKKNYNIIQFCIPISGQVYYFLITESST